VRVEPSLCNRIIKLDRSIRFVGIVNNRGEVIEGGFKQGIEPLLDGTDEQQMYVQSLSNLTVLQSYSDRLGKVRYSLTEHDKVTLLTFPLGNSILCLSTKPKADINKICNKVMKVLKSRGKNSNKPTSSNDRSNKPARKRSKKKTTTTKRIR
jgi:hypothetical protein